MQSNSRSGTYMDLYLDIDGVLLDYNTDTYAKGAIELIEYVTSEFDCYWLTTHCKRDSAPAIEYLSGYFPPEIIEKLKKVKPTYWEDLKTEGIDFDKNFIWLDDYPFNAELSVLENFGVSDSIYRVNLANENELENALAHLKGIKTKIRKSRMAFIYTLLSLILAIILGKTILMCIATSPIGNFETEKDDILKKNFYQKRFITGFREYYDKKCLMGFDIDAGPIIFNLSPTGTAFGIGPATYFKDWEARKKMLKTAELAGFTVSNKNQRHYLLANVALVGEAITLAMKTSTKWK